MPRIRTIKPEFWDSPGTAQASLRARLFFIAMWNWADDYGVGTANAKQLIGFAFPNDDEVTVADFPRLRTEVATCFDVVFYEVDGRPYFAIPSWDKHQKNERRASAKNPGPTAAKNGSDKGLQAGAEMRGTSAPTDGSSGTGTGEQGNRGTEKKTGSEEPDHTEAKPKRRAPKTPIPEHWSPTDRHREYANANRIDLTHEANKFRNGALAHDRRYADWDRAFANWLSDGKAKGWAQILPLDVTERQARTEQTERPFVPLLQKHGRAAR